MTEQKTMRCPFRKDISGEFALCYGAECMAYLEYEQPVVCVTEQNCIEQPPVRVTLCRRMAQPVYYGGGCR